MGTLDELKPILRAVKEGDITAKEGLNKLQRHGKPLCEVELNLHPKVLRCGLKAFEQYEYILSETGNVVVVAGRPGGGKSALVSQIGYEVSKTGGRVVMVSLEMTAAMIKARLLAVAAEVPIKKLGLPVNAAKVKAGMSVLDSCNLCVIDTPGLTARAVIQKCLDEHQAEPIKLVIIDWIGLLQFDNTNRANEVGEAIRLFRFELAQRLRIPVVIVAQMNRAVDAKIWAAKLKKDPLAENVRPDLADLSESSKIEANADCVMMVRRPCLYNPGRSRSDFMVFVLKNRNGTTQDFSLRFSEELVKFYDGEDIDPGSLI